VAAYVLFNPPLSKFDANNPDVDCFAASESGLWAGDRLFCSEDKWLKNGCAPAIEKMKTLGITSVADTSLQLPENLFLKISPCTPIPYSEIGLRVFIRRAS
jgi:hypothetical protein